jgi:hypothetical protein
MRGGLDWEARCGLGRNSEGRSPFSAATDADERALRAAKVADTSASDMAQ